MMDIPTSVTLDAHLAKAGPAADTFARLWVSLWRQQHVPAATLELCRLTLARMHADPAEIAAVNPHLPADAISAERRAGVLAGEALEQPHFSDAEKAAMLFAEYYWMDPQSITDEAADAVKAHVGEAGLVLLIEALGCIDGRIRAARCLRDIAVQFSAKEVAHVG
ncbi:hypothetical protein [Sphingomonas sp. KC8]|uniref:hypothetical protein n=1 Tax=Sphingomonas sp. KC8 TaxID=1030157 RepID=UPI000248A07A|nr:hypothetical protein [Sphingomonas sp. KC8]ARS27682.1 hypothetical protein KC8_10305 [Sphingomonas sp. KC8]